MKRYLTTLAALVLAALVLYPFSAGPVFRVLMLRPHSAVFRVPAFYGPLAAMLAYCPAVQPAWDGYMALWMKNQIDVFRLEMAFAAANAEREAGR